MYTILKDPNIGRKVKIIKPNYYSTRHPDGTYTLVDMQPVNSIGVIKTINKANNSVLVELYNEKHIYSQWFGCNQIEAIDGNE